VKFDEVGLRHRPLLLDWPKSLYHSIMYGFRYVVWSVHVALGVHGFHYNACLYICLYFGNLVRFTLIN